jgi:hypothetical protein
MGRFVLCASIRLIPYTDSRRSYRLPFRVDGRPIQWGARSQHVKSSFMHRQAPWEPNGEGCDYLSLRTFINKSLGRLGASLAAQAQQ